MTIELAQPLRWTETSAGPDVRAIASAEQLADLVNREPMRTVALKPPSPSDTATLMFIGICEQIEDAFAAAGWSSAQALNEKAKLETLRAIVEGRGYNSANDQT